MVKINPADYWDEAFSSKDKFDESKLAWFDEWQWISKMKSDGFELFNKNRSYYKMNLIEHKRSIRRKLIW